MEFCVDKVKNKTGKREQKNAIIGCEEKNGVEKTPMDYEKEKSLRRRSWVRGSRRSSKAELKVKESLLRNINVIIMIVHLLFWDMHFKK